MKNCFKDWSQSTSGCQTVSGYQQTTLVDNFESFKNGRGLLFYAMLYLSIKGITVTKGGHEYLETLSDCYTISSAKTSPMTGTDNKFDDILFHFHAR